MPRIHLGVYLTSGQETINAVQWALEVFSQSLWMTAQLTSIGSRPDIERMWLSDN